MEKTKENGTSRHALRRRRSRVLSISSVHFNFATAMQASSCVGRTAHTISRSTLTNGRMTFSYRPGAAVRLQGHRGADIQSSKSLGFAVYGVAQLAGLKPEFPGLS
jgi:hypothetical protein